MSNKGDGTKSSNSNSIEFTPSKSKYASISHTDVINNDDGVNATPVISELSERPFYISRYGEVVYHDDLYPYADNYNDNTDGLDAPPSKAVARHTTESQSQAVDNVNNDSDAVGVQQTVVTDDDFVMVENAEAEPPSVPGPRLSLALPPPVQISAEQRETEKRREKKWIDMFVNWKKYSSRTSVVKSRVRKGLPESLRGVFWTIFTGAADLKKRIESEHYANLGLGAAGITPRPSMCDESSTNLAHDTAPPHDNGGVGLGSSSHTRVPSTDISPLPGSNSEAHGISSASMQSQSIRDCEYSTSHVNNTPSYSQNAIDAAHAIYSTQPHTSKPSLFSKLAAMPCPMDALISKDVPRTFPNHALFTGSKRKLGDDRLRTALHDVCRAYCNYDPDLGYCQGISFLVATLLMYLEAEDAFWVLVALLNEPKYNLRGLFLTGFALLKQQMYQVSGLLDKLDHKLHEHLTEVGFEYSIILPQWLICLFVYTLPIPLALRIWDILMFEGPKILIRTCLYLILHYRKDMMKQDFDNIAHIFYTRLPKDVALMNDHDKFIDGVLNINITTKQIQDMARKYQTEKEAEDKEREHRNSQ